MSFKQYIIQISILIMIVSHTIAAENNGFSLEKNIKIAQQNDLWLMENQYKQDANDSMSIAAGVFADPKVSVSMANFPTDTFNFGQEAMTQFKLGVSQMLPRGDSLKIKRKQLQIKGQAFPYQRQDRKAQVAVMVSQLWLDAYKARMSIALIEKDRQLFEQLAEISEVNYANAMGRTRGQDIIRAQLELTRLEDRLTLLKQKQEASNERLKQWTGDYLLSSNMQWQATNELEDSPDKELPNIKLTNPIIASTDYSDEEVYQFIKNHPLLMALRQQINSTQLGIDLAKQQFKPAIGINASYGFRGTAPNGANLPDFLSLGVTFDVPLFSKNKQEQELKAAVATTEAIKTKEWLLIRKMLAAFESLRTQLKRLNQRQNLFENQLLPQMHDQAQASLTAYTNDDGDFAEVVRSRIAELNAEIDALKITVDRQKIIAQLNYYFTKRTDLAGE